ncbi:MAG: hypothetical protein J1F03_07930 [Oscillospiraceae bacterium]|nr:hypothetical protein [Oscillospiraceae bacterium]
MRKNILTIRVDDIFEQKCGCPICLMRKASEDNSCEYISGAAMMEPDIRIETNKLGFCAEHFSMLLKTSARLPLALILSTHLDEIQNEAFDKKNSLARSEEFEKTCYICSRTDDDLDRFLHGMFGMYKEDEAFRKLFSEQEYICFPHRSLLINRARKVLKKDVLKQFENETEALAKNRLIQLRGGLDELCKSFDYRNAGKPLSKTAQNAPEKAIEFLTGKFIDN